jgi:Ca2+-binding EF-hand superfamily protein
MTKLFAGIFAAAVAFPAGIAGADDRQDYNRRAAERFSTLFQSLDRDADGTVTRIESQGDLVFGPSFDDMDIDRNGIVTRAELQRFVAQQFEVQLATK